MSLIDHRILVNATPDAVWRVLSDFNALPQWHVTCARTSILTTHQQGEGVRLRLSYDNRPETVQEIVAWYPNLGYEYRVVDGAPYLENLGRIRLQAIPEGTIIQWTFEYTLGGFLSGLRDRLAVNRRLDGEISNSLRQLKRLIEAGGTRMDTATIARVSMRPAPSATERAELAKEAAERDRARQQEREAAASAPTVEMPTVVMPDPVPAAAGPEPPSLLIVEPPVSDEDTKPTAAVADDSERPAVQAAPVLPPELVPVDEEDTRPTVPVMAQQMPDEAADLPATPQQEPDDELFAAPVDTPAFLSGPVDDAPALTMPPVAPTAPVDDTPTEPRGIPAAPASPPPPAAEPAREPSPPTPPETPTPRRAEAVDTVGPSIWEVFNMTPPSESDAATVEPEHAAPPADAQPNDLAASPAPATHATGQSFIQARELDTYEGLRERLARLRAGVRQG